MDAEHRLDNPVLDQLGSKLIAGEIALGESAHEREVDSNIDLIPGRSNNDAHNKNFDTMTNPGIKCQGLDNESKDEASQVQQPPQVLLVGFEEKPKGKNPLEKKRNQVGTVESFKNAMRNFNSNSDQKSKPNMSNANQ